MHPSANKARRSRQKLADSGPLYLEIGHALSLRPDLVPAAEWLPLTQLSWRRAPLPGGAVVDLVSAALGRPPTWVFDSFEMVPIRSGGWSRYTRPSWTVNLCT